MWRAHLLDILRAAATFRRVPSSTPSTATSPARRASSVVDKAASTRNERSIDASRWRSSDCVGHAISLRFPPSVGTRSARWRAAGPDPGSPRYGVTSSSQFGTKEVTFVVVDHPDRDLVVGHPEVLVEVFQVVAPRAIGDVDLLAGGLVGLVSVELELGVLAQRVVEDVRAMPAETAFGVSLDPRLARPSRAGRSSRTAGSPLDAASSSSWRNEVLGERLQPESRRRGRSGISDHLVQVHVLTPVRRRQWC